METKRITIAEKELNINRSKNWETKDLEEKLQEAAELIKRGEVVAFPTETVYGLGADALNAQACRKIFEIKGRPADNPLIVHIAAKEEAVRITRYWPKEADICSEKFWPGPLTLVLPKGRCIPDAVTGGLDTVAVRMPAHPAALALIRSSGCPLAAPSANISGKPSPTDGEHVWRDLQGKIPLIIDAGKCNIGLESTVLDLSGETPTILRPGGVTREELERELGRVELDKALLPESKSVQAVKPKSPGMKYRHYAPEGELVLLMGSGAEILAKIKVEINQKESARTIGLLCMKETACLLDEESRQKIDLLFVLGSKGNPQEAASRLFEGLRLCDEHKISYILAEGMDSQGIGLAFMNRLKKAAGKNSGQGEENWI